MKVNLGQKIRELRKEYSRTQEAMATALGVTPQAISRWEASGGYPDMEMIPAIANYFHITIDELFGYSDDREAVIKDILERAEKAINSYENLEECVEMLRNASEEFPGEGKILLNLVYSLVSLGWQKHGARSCTKDGSDYSYPDTEYNRTNIY